MGFGPITTGEDDLAERKWRIDPIIQGINQRNGKYVAGFFLKPQEMEKFDMIVIVKKINPEFFAVIQKCKGKRFVYDIVDNPNDEEKYRFYFRFFPAFLQRMNAFILSSPVHEAWMHQIKKPSLLIEHPILNRVHKTDYQNRGEVRLLAQGYFENLQNLQWLEEILPFLSQKVGRRICLYYHSEKEGKNSEFVRYIKWSVANCFEVMRESDIAVTIKDLHKPHQYTKPATKIIAYMAAGLPVIAKPTSADRLVMHDRITGFFAYREEDWRLWIEQLALRPAFRRQIGRAARKSVLQKYSLDSILDKYFSVFDKVFDG